MAVGYFEGVNYFLGDVWEGGASLGCRAGTPLHAEGLAVPSVLGLPPDAGQGRAGQGCGLEEGWGTQRKCQ